MSFSSEEYTYTPFENTTEIRLLTIHAGKAEDPVTCSLDVWDLENEPIYEALSYCWGPGNSETMVLNGILFRLRENLWSALWHLREQGKDRLIWADAVCINQKDIPERNSQIRLMKDIYKRATRVIAWLGTSSEDSDVVMRWLTTPHYGREWSNEMELGIKKIGEREYWQRMWVIQECYHARELIIQIGNFSIGWRALFHAIDWNVSVFAQSVLGVARNQGLRRLQRHTIVHLINQFMDHRCTDPRDTVYAILSLLPEEAVNGIEVDYSKSLMAVFCDILQLQSEMTDVHKDSYIKSKAVNPQGFPILLFSQILHWFVEIGHKDLPKKNKDVSAPFPKRVPSLNQDYREKSGEDNKKAFLESYPGEIPDPILAWLEVDEDRDNPKHKRDGFQFWKRSSVLQPQSFPPELAKLRKLKLFLESFEMLGVLRLSMSNAEVMVDMCTPTPSRPCIVMQRQTGVFKVYRKAAEDEVGGGYREWRDFIYRYNFCSPSWIFSISILDD